MQAGSEVTTPAPAPRRRKAKGELAIPETAGLSVEARALELAIKREAPLEQLEKFMQLKRQHEADEARKDFNRAFAAFKAEAVVVTKGTQILDGPLKGKFHADLADVVDASTPFLSKHGLSLSWKTTKDEKDWIEVTATLRHVGGHVEVESQGGAPDTGPGRNAIQARCSTRTYLERYTAMAIMGLAAKGADDDGAGGRGALTLVSEEQAATLTALMEEVKADPTRFYNWATDKFKVKVVKVEDIPAKVYKDCVFALEEKRKAPAK